MAFADDAKDDFATILGGEFSEIVHYRQMTAAGLQPPKAISAVVKRGDAMEPLSLGSTGRSGNQPAELYISKDATVGISAINPRGDLVLLDPGTTKEQRYSVLAILDNEDPAAWRLHAAP